MKKKKVKSYTYDGLGFPVELVEVDMLFIDGGWQPKIDIRRVADQAIKALVVQPGRLTGHQVKFIRTYFSMTLRDFAKQVVHESHTAVAKWEKFGDEVTNMDGNIEAMLRLYIYEQLCANTVKQKNEFFKQYQQVKQLFSAKNTPIVLQIAG